MMMGRPPYNTKADRINQRQIADQFESIWDGFALILRPDRFDPVDADILRERDDRVVGVMEIKDRKYPMWKLDRWRGYMIGLLKYNGIRHQARQLRVPGLIGIRTTDGLGGTIWWHRIDGLHDGIWWDGRRDRNDDRDMEWCVHLMSERFQKLSP